jgi:hypothetical protein
MNISKVLPFDDGSIVAEVVDDDGGVVGFNVYAPESFPKPNADGELMNGPWRRFVHWLSG